MVTVTMVTIVTLVTMVTIVNMVVFEIGCLFVILRVKPKFVLGRHNLTSEAANVVKVEERKVY